MSDTSQPPVKPTPAKVTKAERPSWKFHKKSSTESKKTQNVAKEAENGINSVTCIAKDYRSQEKEKD